MTTQTFSLELDTIRKRARSEMERGAVTAGYRADRDTVIELLNCALATELLCVLRYKRHYHLASGAHAEPVAAEFLEHAQEEQEHADRIAARIVQLGGRPDYSPDGLADRAHSEFGAGETLSEMLRDDLVAERIAIQSYGEIIRYLGDDDPTTRRMLEEILASEEEHADDLASLLEGQPDAR